jgi:hypothetical protein
MDHVVVSEAVVVIVVLIERNRKTGDYDNDNDKNFIHRTVSGRAAS